MNISRDRVLATWSSLSRKHSYSPPFSSPEPVSGENRCIIAERVIPHVTLPARFPRSPSQLAQRLLLTREAGPIRRDQPSSVLSHGELVAQLFPAGRPGEQDSGHARHDVC